MKICCQSGLYIRTYSYTYTYKFGEVILNSTYIVGFQAESPFSTLGLQIERI